MREATNKSSPGVLIALCFLIWAFATLGDYGITIDEPLHHASGEMNLAHFFGSTQAIENYHNLKYYGPVSDMIGVLTYLLGHKLFRIFNAVDARHLHLILFFSMSILLIYWISLCFWNKPTAVMSALFFMLNPRLIGHAHNNPKEIPLIAWMLLLVFFMLKRQDTGNQLWTAATAAAFGMAFATKINALLFLPAVCLWLLHLAGIRHTLKKRQISLVLEITAFVLFAFLTIVIVWPWLRVSPIKHLVQMIQFFSHHPKTGMVLYGGTVYPIGQTPWHYGLGYLVMTTPPVMLVLGIAGIFSNFFRRHHRDPSLWFCFYWFLLGVLPQSLPNSVIYDGPRHFFPVYPAIALAAGRVAFLITWSFRSILPRYLKRYLTYIPAIAVFVHSGHVIWQYHPYQNCYYNCFIGGVRGAVGRFEISSWGHSLREAIRCVNESAPPNINVYVPYPKGLARYYLRPDLKESSEMPFFVVTSTFREPEQLMKLKPWDTVEVEGVILNKIYRGFIVVGSGSTVQPF